MNAHARHNTSKSTPINLAVNCIVMHDFFPVPLTDVEEEVLQAYEKAIQNKKGIADAAEITRLRGTKNSTRVSEKLWELAKSGRAFAYSRNGKWHWCTREVAEAMLRYQPNLLTPFEDLIKSAGDKGLPTGKRQVK